MPSSTLVNFCIVGVMFVMDLNTSFSKYTGTVKSSLRNHNRSYPRSATRFKSPKYYLKIDE